MSFEKRLEKVQALSNVLKEKKGEIVCRAVSDLNFTVSDCEKELEVTTQRLKMFKEAAPFLKDRNPLGGRDSSVSLMLSYNGSAWLNTAITSIYLVGNRVNVKFASRGSSVMQFTEEIYRPIFGDEIMFYRGSGREFVDDSLRDLETSALVVFGFDENILPYRDAFAGAGKKLVFEGPGQDPFIVFSDADLSLALEDFMMAKFMYSGQTCTAPKRIFVERSIYDVFVDEVAVRAGRLVVGDPRNGDTDISAVASDLAVQRIESQLRDALGKGGKIVTGGKIEGNLIYPTVVKDARDDMLGMQEEIFGPVAFISPFEDEAEVVRRAKDHKYGLRAAIFGGEAAHRTAMALKGEDYCHFVGDYTFGKFGTVALNQTRADSWKGAFVVKAVGGYGFSGWIWETVNGHFRMKQGPKLLSIETSAQL